MGESRGDMGGTVWQWLFGGRLTSLEQYLKDEPRRQRAMPASPGHVLQEELQLPHAQLGIMCLGQVFNMQVQLNALTMVFYYKKTTLCILGI